MEVLTEELSVVTALERYSEEGKRRLSPLYPCVNRPVDFSFGDWLMLFSLTLQFRPELIVEVGRGSGNSTCVFLEAAAELNCPVVSFDRTITGRSWRATERRVRAIKGSEWFRRGQIIKKDFTKVDPRKAVPDEAGRTLFFWDAHGKGKDLGHFMIRRIFPRLQTRPNLIIVHDITDLRGGLLGRNPRYFVRGTFSSGFEELLPLYDFWQSEGIDVSSPADDLATWMTKDFPRIRRITEDFPESSRPILGPAGHWVYFQLRRSSQNQPLNEQVE
jgi:hypothetical protein